MRSCIPHDSVGLAAECGGDFFSLYTYDGMFKDKLKFAWGVGYSGKVSCYADTLYADGFYAKLLYGENFKALVDTEDERPNPRIVYKGSKTMKNVTANKMFRHKFAKFMSCHFDWYGADHINLYDDGKYSFYFEEIRKGGKRGICGGVILHDADDPAKAHYSMHT